MKTTIDLPDDILERAKIAAARRRTAPKKLVIEGLETFFGRNPPPLSRLMPSRDFSRATALGAPHFPARKRILVERFIDARSGDATRGVAGKPGLHVVATARLPARPDHFRRA